MTETIIILCVLTILFVITWIVIASNAPDNLPPIRCNNPFEERNIYVGCYEHRKITGDIKNLEKMIMNMNADMAPWKVNTLFKTPEAGLSKEKTEKLIAELEKRGVVSDGKVLKN